jgi:hypothetical protein
MSVYGSGEVWSSQGSATLPAPNETGANFVNGYFHQDMMRTTVSIPFTSNYNVRYLMLQLIEAVKRLTGKVIGPQSIKDLAFIMKRTYLENGPYHYNLPDIEVEKLNRIVLQKIIHITTQGVESYDRYLNDSFTQPVPPDRPSNVSTKGDRQFEINYFL